MQGSIVWTALENCALKFIRTKCVLVIGAKQAIFCQKESNYFFAVRLLEIPVHNYRMYFGNNTSVIIF